MWRGVRLRASGHWSGLVAVRLSIGLALLTLVVHPLLSGRVLLLDFYANGHAPILGRAGHGLDGGLTVAVPWQVAFLLLQRLLGGLLSWLPFAAVFPLAAAGGARLVGGDRTSRTAAGLLYAFNPFTFDRLAVGQIGLLLGYAFLPFAVRALLAIKPRDATTLARGALWWAIVGTLSVHFLWIVGVAALCTILVRRQPRGLLALAFTAALVAVLSSYLFFAQLGQQRPLTVGASDVAAYATRADPHLGLYVNVLGLYGFWRQGPRLPKDVVHVWPYLLAVILLIAVVGAWSALRVPGRRQLASVLLLSGTASYFLALGTQGPTGWLFRFLFDHVPLFQVMREPQKFLCLTALAYAVLFGWGVQWLRAWAREERLLRVALTVLVLFLPLAYSPAFVNGLSGQVTGATVPTSFARADRLMGDGPDQILFLPWHEYLSFPWTGRVVTNPAPALFRRDVIVGDNVELPGVYSTSTSTRSAYLQGLYATGAGQSDFGSKIARLGVRYVAVAKTLDWQSFDWLHAQGDLRVLLDTADLTVYEVTTRVDLGARLAPDGTRGAAVTRRSPVTYDIPAGPPGQVELAEPYDAAWRLGGAPPVRTEQGTMRFPVGAGATTARFTHWPLTLAGHLISVTTALVLAVLLFRDRRRRRRQGSDLVGQRSVDAPLAGGDLQEFRGDVGPRPGPARPTLLRRGFRQGRQPSD